MKKSAYTMIFPVAALLAVAAWTAPALSYAYESSRSYVGAKRYSNTNVQKYKQRAPISKVNPGGPVSLNPQPLPPKESAASRSIYNKGSRVQLNPQPLPPKALPR